MSDDLLREAAAKMRATAQAATAGVWTQRILTNLGPQAQVMVEGGDLLISQRGEPYRGAENAAHIASWHPTVALAVADLLLILADHIDDGVIYDDGATAHRALDLATAYLGAAS